MYGIIDFEYFDNKDSVLIALQKYSNCSFEIKRVFYIFDVPSGVIRGNHANRDSRFILITIKGKCKVCVDNNISQVEFSLNNPKQVLYLDKMLWKQMYDFSDDCILLVVNDKYYCKDEYIYNYCEYIESMGEGGYNYAAMVA